MAEEIRSTELRKSRYVQGGSTEVHPTRLGWWERRNIPRANDDISVTIDQKYTKRPDLVAYDAYGSASLQWLVLQFNNILDINTEFVEGKTIFLPTEQRLFMEIMNKPVGGVRPKTQE